MLQLLTLQQAKIDAFEHWRLFGVSLVMAFDLVIIAAQNNFILRACGFNTHQLFENFDQLLWLVK
jgi:hypothetical protein